MKKYALGVPNVTSKETKGPIGVCANLLTCVFNKIEHTQVPLPNRSAPFMEDIHVSAE